jgi:hypothetical protein
MRSQPGQYQCPQWPGKSLGTFFLTLVDSKFTSLCLVGLLPMWPGLRGDFGRHHERAVCLPHHSAGN